MFRHDCVPQPRSTIGQRRVAIEFGMTAFSSAGPAIGQRRIAIEFGLTAFTSPVPAILRGLPPIRQLASGQRQAMNGVGALSAPHRRLDSSAA